MIVSVANLTTTETEIFETSPQLFVPKESNEKNLQMLKLPHRFLSVYSTLIHIIASFLCSSDVRGDFPATRFDLGTLTLSSLKLLGDAHLNNGTIKLTRELSVPTSTAGKALYGKPVKFRHPDTHSPASFTTYFSFTVTNLNPSSIGGGLAFVICPDGEYIGSSGGFLGLTEETGSGSGFVAVEFDTLMDVEFKDVNGNHVGLDLNAVVSAAVSDLGNFDIDLKSGNSVNSWITYDGSGRVLTVYVSYSNVKPESPILSVPLDLDRYVTDSMFVGFSGSTQGSTEIHSIDWWSFTSSFESSESPPPMSNSPPLSSSSASIVPSVSTVRRKTADPSSSCRNKLCKKSPAAVAGVVTAGAFFLALFAGVIIWVYSNKIKYNRKSESFPSEIIKSPREFTYKELKLATDSFSSSRVIGNGAFGTVYRGILPDSGETIAIKRCSHISQGNTEFLSELSLIGTLRHRNLLRLQGYCREKGEILLIYDLMPNGSLDKALYESPTTLPWPHRRQILRGVASALAYLHQECENQIIHRDVKTSNIMLDASFNPKLGDFGLARQTEHDKSPDATAAAGTMGYLAPEYLLTGRATEKTDVFSYGAVVLEVCTGRRPITRPEPEPGLRPGLRSSLVDWVWGLYREGKLLTAVDERLRNGGEFNPEEINRVLMVGLACSKPDPVTRPTMRSVVQILVGEADVPEVPIAKPSSSMSFSTSELLLTLQDSVSDCNEVLAPISTTSCSSSEHDIFIVGKDRSV